MFNEFKRKKLSGEKKFSNLKFEREPVCRSCNFLL